MSVRAVRLLPAFLLGACLVAPAFAATTTTTKSAPVHHKTTSSKSKSSKGPALIWRGDVTTARAVVTDIAKEWQRTGHARIELQPFNTASGIDAVAGGTADLAGSARGSDGTPEDSRLTFTPVAWDALVMITNPSNPVRNLTVRQLHEIYFGKITNWKDVGGKDAPIDLYAVISPNDGVEYSLRALLYGHGDQQISAPRLYLNTKALEDGIALNPNGLGLSTLANVNGNPKLRTIPVDGVAPTVANIADGSYPLYTPLYLVTNPNSTKAAAVKDFVDFLQSDKAKAVLRDHSVLPYQDGIALVAKDEERREKVYAESTASNAKPPLAAPGASYAAAAAIAPTSERTEAARAALDERNAAAKETAAASTGAGKPAGEASKAYTVAKGDTLSGIAQKHGVTVADLRDWNHLKNDNIKLGQSLQVSHD
ncbi:substrate-binding domain-containing protein [Rhodanobacter sp. DHB23]|uniref:substrate-binding domain-containing protein n=1 Tax=Rhodanobacter sp. DHB23 TaxID=2775923 RepID=UPI0017814D3B|nr:substrate-binding domain-containing protein [Rhodanobacter sp. DHB23]MBD8873384.1 substrate-binding domain-containing protein [Rhodanobacter sp. DHB23]